MHSTKEFEGLLKKYKEGDISFDEIYKLNSYMNNEENIIETDTFYKQAWTISNKHNNEISSARVWKRIKGKIAEDFSIKISKTNRTTNLSRGFLRYTAVIILSIILSWFTYQKFGSKEVISKKIYSEYSVPYGSRSRIVLPDGTKVWLNSGSKLRYQDQFIAGERVVYLEGEAFFDVTANKIKPFIVKTAELNIRVYGTKFNVKSFSEENVIETALVSGSVVVEKTDINGRIIQDMKMLPNQIVSYSKISGDFTLNTPGVTAQNQNEKKPVTSTTIDLTKPIKPKSIELATSWKDDRFTFKDEDFESLILRLQRWYDVEITLLNKNLKNFTFTGTFDKETVEQALDALKLTTHFTYTIEKNKVVIK